MPDSVAPDCIWLSRFWEVVPRRLATGCNTCCALGGSFCKLVGGQGYWAAVTPPIVLDIVRAPLLGSPDNRPRPMRIEPGEPRFSKGSSRPNEEECTARRAESADLSG